MCTDPFIVREAPHIDDIVVFVLCEGCDALNLGSVLWADTDL